MKWQLRYKNSKELKVIEENLDLQDQPVLRVKMDVVVNQESWDHQVNQAFLELLGFQVWMVFLVPLENQDQKDTVVKLVNRAKMLTKGRKDNVVFLGMVVTLVR